MSYLKYTPFLYLIVAIAFLYDAINKWNDPAATPYLSIAFAAVCVFMFFFRRNFANKLHNRNNKS
ncbi:hypothetical protein [Flavobacterium sp.]|uniref:hypothetical protein n=1 Tax=Flavobacterium sp. TaxID=239 RepID=UPI00262F0E14|nr:hypothetical protein [Flavobacterium sp.]MDG2431502.1 hypothetical protein [Flavobacterium sp.]